MPHGRLLICLSLLSFVFPCMLLHLSFMTGSRPFGQVVSLKMNLHGDIVERLNAALPPAIRAFGYRRVTNGFDSRKLCDRCGAHFASALRKFPGVRRRAATLVKTKGSRVCAALHKSRPTHCDQKGRCMRV